MGLITVDEFHNLPLGIKGPRSLPDADKLAEHIETASTQVEEYCERKFALAQRTEVLRGKDSYRLILGEYPLVSVDEVAWEDDITGATGSIDTSLLRAIEDGWIEFKRRGQINTGYVYANLEWFDSSRVYTVKYTAGYDPVPGPVKHAVALQVTELLQPNFGGPQQEVPELVPLSSQLIVDLLDPYRRRFKRA